MALPDPIHGGFAHALSFGHRAAAPVGGPGGLGLERCVNNLPDFLRRQRGLASASFGHFPQTVQPCADKPLPPQSHGLEIEAQIVGDVLVLLTLGRRQKDPAALRNLRRSQMRGHPALQFLTIGFGQVHGQCMSRHGARLPHQNYNSSYL